MSKRKLKIQAGVTAVERETNQKYQDYLHQKAIKLHDLTLECPFKLNDPVFFLMNGTVQQGYFQKVQEYYGGPEFCYMIFSEPSVDGRAGNGTYHRASPNLCRKTREEIAELHKEFIAKELQRQGIYVEIQNLKSPHV